MSDDEKYTISKDRLAEIRLKDAELRAARAEQAMAARQLKDAEQAMARLQDELSSEISDDGEYEITSPIDANTGAVSRKRRAEAAH